MLSSHSCRHTCNEAPSACVCVCVGVISVDVARLTVSCVDRKLVLIDGMDRAGKSVDFRSLLCNRLPSL